MGKFHEKIDSKEDSYTIAKIDLEMWLSEFALEYSQAQTFSGQRRVVKEWFG